MLAGSALGLMISGTIRAGCRSIDAARMDIAHSNVWGRSESARTFLRYLFEAAAPLAFGYLSTRLGSASGTFAAAHNPQESASGLMWTFLIMSIPLIAAGVILLFATRSYPRDVANAMSAERGESHG